MNVNLKEHIADMDAKGLIIPNFPPNLAWFNSQPLSFNKELKGKIVLLDFWTYCCINCMHVLPDLAYLEKKYADKPVVFVGVHSAKFDNEKDDENIRKAILRYDIGHPVVNDAEMILWQKLGVSSWPTLALIGPSGQILLAVSGEGKRELIDQAIAFALDYFADQLNSNPIPLSLEKDKVPKDSRLRFPGKLAIDPLNKKLFISDSNNNRIIVTDLTGKIEQVIGSGYPGMLDGNFQEARFNRLQGIAYHDNMLYVADTENHCLRRVDLEKKQVTTLAGDGKQGYDYHGGGKGTSQPLSTPWDLVYYAKHASLFIAMAGTHQIWNYDLTNGRAACFSGSGAEQNYNSKNLLTAAWAQPSGITLGNDTLFIADSESSSIRMIDLSQGSTKTLVGGDSRNPSNLFSFGDQDGYGDLAKLQHPLGVLWLEKEKLVVIADTYNHRIKALNPSSGHVVTWAGSGKSGFRDGIGIEAQFAEPSGFALSLEGDKLFIADANNHAIRVLEINTKKVETLHIT